MAAEIRSNSHEFEEPSQSDNLQALPYAPNEYWAENYYRVNQSPAMPEPRLATNPNLFQAHIRSRDFNEDLFALHSPQPPVAANFDRQYTTHYPPFEFENAQFMDICDQISNNTTHFHTEKLQITPNTCQQCQKQFLNKYRLDSHATRDKHKAYACLCGESFLRWDVLNLHINKFHPLDTYPCPYCTKSKPFPRADHLTQHLRSFHNIEIPDRYEDNFEAPSNTRGGKKYITCPHEGCVFHEGDVFNARREFTQHLREVHDECLFPCKMPGCSKVGGKGFFREGDLIKHEKAQHQDQLLAE